MSLTRKLIFFVALAFVSVWALTAWQLRDSVSGYFRAFDIDSRNSTRAHINAEISLLGERLKADAKYWLAANMPTDDAGLDAIATQPDTFPELQVRDADILSLFSADGRLLWSTAADGKPWSQNTLRGKDGAIALFQNEDFAPDQAQFFISTSDSVQIAHLVQVRNNSSDQPAGYLITASHIDKGALEQIQPGETTPVSVSFPALEPVPDAMRPIVDGTADSGAGANADWFELEQHAAMTLVRYDDVFGSPALLVGVAEPRFSATLNETPSVALMKTLTLVSIFCLLALSGLIDRVVGAPLRRFGERISDMSEGDDARALLAESSNEIVAIERLFEALIGEREERESSLRYLASAVNAAEDAVAIIDMTGPLRYVNPGFERLTGISADKAIGDSDWWQKVFVTNVMSPNNEGNDWSGELRIRRTDGTIRTVEASSNRLDSVGPAGDYFVIVMHDITERNAQIAEIERLATAVKTIEDCIIIADSEGRIIYANPAYEERCGQPLAEMLGSQTNKLSHAASPPEVYAELQETVLAGKPWRGELRASFDDGRYVIDEAVVSPVIDEHGEIVNYVTTLHDVTERATMESDLRNANRRIEQSKDELEVRVAERTEELREAKETAESANHAKSAFLATVSHEIRTPLNGVLGMLELLRDHTLNKEQMQLLRSADTSASILLTLINDILDFSKIEAGQLILDETPVSLRDVTESVLLSLAASAHSKGIRLQSSIDPSLPEVVKLDGVRVQQILLNLLSNAIKFTGTDGREGQVRLDVELSSVDGTDMLRFTVEDNGIGIPDSSMATLFRPFTQAESSTTRRFGGTGLGLSISAKLAKIMGGRIDVVSELGHGSVFTVTLPLAEADETAQLKFLRPLNTTRGRSSTSSDDYEHIRGHILVAEDNPINQQVIKLQLRAIGFSCDIANDGAEAFELWNSGTYDMVLTDCHMPNVDGFGLAEAIRASGAKGTHIPIIALTANVLSEEAEACRAAGMDECLTKPIERALLDKTISIHLTAEVLARPAQQETDRAEAPTVSSLATNDLELPTDEASLPAIGEPKAVSDSGQQLLDMRVFAENIGDDLLVQHELLRRFASEADKNLLECLTALSEQDTAVLECNAHKLKSAARTIGATALADTCVAIEQAARDDDDEKLALLIEEQAGLIKLLNQEIDKEINSASDAHASACET
ncbi:MAG: PAS domain S-box protein [Gammaproteobacteria bacterium]|nr:PAS domain S-box protein [Gammaproteobacteria bacterium]